MRGLLYAALLATFPTLSSSLHAEAPVDVIPPRAALLFAVDDPVGLLGIVESLPLDRIEDEVPAVRALMTSPQILAARGGLIWVEGQLGAKYPEFLKVAAGSGLAIGIENEKSIVIVTRSPAPERLAGLLRAVTQLASGMKVGRDAPAPEPAGSHRDIDAYKLGEGIVAVVNDSLIIASNSELAKATVDRLLDGGDKKLWKALREGSPTSVRMLLRHEALPEIESQLAKLIGPSDDFGRELILGGAISALAANGVSSAKLDLESDKLTARWNILGRPDLGRPEAIDPNTGEVLENEYSDLQSLRMQIAGGSSMDNVGGRSSSNDSRKPLETEPLGEGMIAEMTVYRDVAKLWSEKDTLLTENVAAQLDVSDSQLSTAFGGFDFGDEVLGALNPTMRIVVFPPANQASSPPVLPEAAFIATLRDGQPDQVARRFRIAWQTIIGLVNVERGGNGQPQLELETSSENNVRMMTGRYSLQDAEELNADSVDLYATLAPTMVTGNGRMVIATSDTLAKKTMQSASMIPGGNEGDFVSLAVDGQEVAKLLTLNRAALLGQNILEKGHTRSEAEGEVDTLIGAVGLMKRLAVRAVVGQGNLNAVAELSWLANDEAP